MSLKQALAGVKQSQAEADVEAVAIPARRPSSEKADNGRASGKSSSKDYERLTVYVLKKTKKDSSRKWEDATGRDMSDLVETLLTKYLDT